jgi:hypothetical protein
VEGICSGIFPNSLGIPTKNGEKSLKKARNTDAVDKIFYVLLNGHLGIILANNQLDALSNVFTYFTSLHVSSNLVLIIRRINCINTSSGIYHSV